MIRKYLLLPAVFSLATLFMAGSVAQAQHRSGGHSGGHAVSHVSGSHGVYHGGYSHGAYYHPGYSHGGYYHGHVGIGLYRSYGYGGYGYPYSYGYPSYYYPSTDYYPPTYYYPPASDFTPSITTSPVSDYPAENTATVRVIVPDPQASVWFNGTLTQQKGTDRTFSTPELTTGSTYSYTVRATWMEGGRQVTQDRVIRVTPGGAAVVDFTRTGVRDS